MKILDIFTTIAAITLLTCGLALAQSMGGMNMGSSAASPSASSSAGMQGMSMSGMNSVHFDPDNMKEGEMDAMSMDIMNGMTGRDMSMGNMALHMTYTKLRPENAADQKRADDIVDQLKKTLAKYQDYHAAEAAGFKPFHPEIKQLKVVHFTKNWYGLKAAFVFNPEQPTSLLYERTKGGGYKLIGAMYTDRRNASEDQLNERIPLSVARWHRHIKLCFPQKGTDPSTVDWTKFGFNGSIDNKAACDAAGGRFYPQVFGWMVHVYPWDPNPKLVWAK
jgi:hypothetical protein